MLEQTISTFTLQGFYPYVPFLGSFAETGDEVESVIDPLQVQAPTSVYRALQAAGVIDDPFFEQNSLRCEWVSNRWWRFRTSFRAKKEPGRRYELVLHNLDFRAHIYLNHNKLGLSENLFVPFRADVTQLLQEENELVILLEHAPDECGQMGLTSITKTQKPRFNYKWDWCMRMVGVGIGACELHSYRICAVRSVLQKQSFAVDGSCSVRVAVQLEGFTQTDCTMRLCLSDGKTCVDTVTQSCVVQPGLQTHTTTLFLAQPKRWWPNGHGAQPLYDLNVQILDNAGTLVAQRSVQISLREVQYLQNDNAPADALPYKLVINGKPIYIKGVNLTPLEMNHADVTEQREWAVLQSIAAANCNLIRVWGGGYISTDTMLDACDRLGILVWQEFPQSSSGVENVPSKDAGFLAQMEKTVRASALRLQTHPSLAYYSGGNELSDETGAPVGYDDENITLIQNTLQDTLGEYAQTLLLPSSPSGGNYFLDVDKPGLNHDVHGPWKYAGATGQYTLYNRSDSLFHSEFGVDGMANFCTLQKILSDKHLYVTDMAHDVVWRHLGEMWDTYDRTEEIFGSLHDQQLPGFIALSQYIQAEGLRYALEANRRRAFENSGSIIWQFNEPRPNVSGTYIEDYYGEKKLAYYFVRDAFRTLTPSLRYDKLLWDVGESCTVQPVVLNDAGALDGTLDVEVRTEEGQLLTQRSEPVTLAACCNAALAPLSFPIPQTKSIHLSLTLTGNGHSVRTEYLLFIQDAQGHASADSVFRWLQEKMPNAQT